MVKCNGVKYANSPYKVAEEISKLINKDAKILSTNSVNAEDVWQDKSNTYAVYFTVEIEDTQEAYDAFQEAIHPNWFATINQW